MKIILNGAPREFDGEMTVTGLLAEIGLGGKPVVVEIDETPVFPRDYPQVTVTDGSRVEVIMLAAGG
jgi:sulfur carrier protein